MPTHNREASPLPQGPFLLSLTSVAAPGDRPGSPPGVLPRLTLSWDVSSRERVMSPAGGVWGLPVTFCILENSTSIMVPKRVKKGQQPGSALLRENLHLWLLPALSGLTEALRTPPAGFAPGHSEKVGAVPGLLLSSTCPLGRGARDR